MDAPDSASRPTPEDALAEAIGEALVAEATTGAREHPRLRAALGHFVTREKVGALPMLQILLHVRPIFERATESAGVSPETARALRERVIEWIMAAYYGRG